MPEETRSRVLPPAACAPICLLCCRLLSVPTRVLLPTCAHSARGSKELQLSTLQCPALKAGCVQSPEPPQHRRTDDGDADRTASGAQAEECRARETPPPQSLLLRSRTLPNQLVRLIHFRNFQVRVFSADDCRCMDGRADAQTPAKSRRRLPGPGKAQRRNFQVTSTP